MFVVYGDDVVLWCLCGMCMCDNGGFVVRLRYVVIVVGLWWFDGGCMVLMWYVVMIVGLWCLCGMW